MRANICNDSKAETPVHNNSAHEQLYVASALVGLLQRMIKSAAFGAKHVVFIAFFSVVSAVLVYLFMGASTSNTMSQPYIVKATAKHTASVSQWWTLVSFRCAPAPLRPVLSLCQSRVSVTALPTRQLPVQFSAVSLSVSVSVTACDCTLSLAQAWYHRDRGTVVPTRWGWY